MKFKLIPIVKIEKEYYKGMLHDLTVKDNHSYNIKNIVVHNSICSTRIATGFGMPTLTSIFDCAKVKETAYLVADGGIESPGDICKAMAAGADMCMIGKLLASTDLSNADKLDKDGKLTCNENEYKFVTYSGMASKEAIQKLNSKKSVVSIEGVSGCIPYTGKSEEVVNNIIGNIQSSMSYYAGCRNWDEFRRKVKFVEITQQGWEESKTRVKI
jgi:IMP dehydrogenase